MMVLISERQEPQLVPARNSRADLLDGGAAGRNGGASWFTPTLKQEQTMRPTDGIGRGERPDSSAMRSAIDSGWREASSDTSQSRVGN